MRTGDIWLDNTSRNTLLVVNGDKSLRGGMDVTAAGRTSTLYLKSHDLFPYYPSDPLLTACDSLCVCVETEDRTKAGGGEVKGEVKGKGGRRGHRGGRGRQRDEPSLHTVNARVNGGVSVFTVSPRNQKDGRIMHLSFWLSEYVTAGRRRKH